jgi:hypothetical protein
MEGKSLKGSKRNKIMGEGSKGSYRRRKRKRIQKRKQTKVIKKSL